MLFALIRLGTLHYALLHSRPDLAREGNSHRMKKTMQKFVFMR